VGSVPADGVKGKTWGPSTLTSSRSRPNIVDTQGRSVHLSLILFISVLNLDYCCGLNRYDTDPDPNFHFDADPEPGPDPEIGINMMPIHMRILPQVLDMLENQNF
jgi:hypothetical protein